jgi:hypothetical protein
MYFKIPLPELTKLPHSQPFKTNDEKDFVVSFVPCLKGVMAIAVSPIQEEATKDLKRNTSAPAKLPQGSILSGVRYEGHQETRLSTRMAPRPT